MTRPKNFFRYIFRLNSLSGSVVRLIIRGGVNICPRAIEELLFSHPAISDVQVFGIADEKNGEEVCAWIIPHRGAELTGDDVKALCKGRIALYKVPWYVRMGYLRCGDQCVSARGKDWGESGRPMLLPRVSTRPKPAPNLTFSLRVKIDRTAHA